MRRCVIVGGAPIENYERIRSYCSDDDFYIFCDSGLKHCDDLGARPQLIIGDFDSYENPKNGIETIELPTVKDDTDTVSALKEAVMRGYKDFLLVGMTGRRLDHTLGNVYMLVKLEELGKTALMVDDYSEISIIGSGKIKEIDDSFPFFSLLNITGTAKGINVKNAKYPLRDAEIESGYQYGVSNEVLPGKKAEITVSEGMLLLIRDIVG
ncbi:MAG: thiamine diphosphokinase [Eubacteriales bacterium]|nr:thiamine diphosphokinase [Eubacteriales bacterium]